MSKIAFVGLGNMGSPMAKKLVDVGHKVYGYDLVSEAVKKHHDAGGIVAGSPLDAVKQAEVVISMLPSGSHVERLYLGRDGLLSAMCAGQLIIESSTIEPDIARSVASEAGDKGIDFIDAPVSGGSAGASEGTLTFMVGGRNKDLDRARPFLESMGRLIFHAGEVGAGQLAKICNNMLLAVVMVGTSEALKLGIDNGLDPTVLSEIMKQSSGGNWVLERYNPVPGVMVDSPASHGYQGGFTVGLMSKDLGLALTTAAITKTAAPVASLADSLYRLHGQKAGTHLDFSSIYKFLSE
ncbi:MAG: 3-hydroxyisobutyrate dehydrogenase [Candidatus Endonucleobacter bathymodioli]|uniref:3-hydroxyisobutyrate dehydrogenase n=1 Tax=Candidatus Endonucleibacter bathymodioli TaxID=539814 RepID=A0AA90NLJ5_9GAMM|nr:3-hydroxyisobutyrate dehydrogenase [Candidatus Endonucleobacter bathymodioli]